MKNVYSRGLRYALLATLTMGVVACDDNPPAATADVGPGGAGGAGGDTGDADVGGSGGTGGDTPVSCDSDADCIDGRYCDKPEDDPFASGTCLVGCRLDPDSCADGEACDAESRECRALGCNGDDTQCAENQYCGADDACVDGCRTEPDNCGLQEGGADGYCNPESRVCEALTVCCSADNTCSQVPDGTCDGRALGAVATCEGNPCDATVCANDGECAEGEYCDVDNGICLAGCRVDERCPNGDLVCDGDSRTCVEQACESNDDCALDFHFCNEELNLCREGQCRDDAACIEQFGDAFSCVNGQCLNICDPEDAAACGEGSYCDPNQRTCREECGGHDACEENEACNFDNNECVRGLCRDDANEPNDVVGSATAVPVGEPMGNVRLGGLDDLIMCYDDVSEGSTVSEDYYAIELNQGERLEIRLVNPGVGDSNLDLELLGDEVEDAQLSETLEVIERIRYPEANVILPATTYYARVFGDIDEATDYSVEVTIVDSTNPCFPDAREPGDDDWNGATELAGDQARFAGSICRGDEDWYSKGMGRNDGFTLELSTPANSAPLSVSLYSNTALNGPGGLANPGHTAGMPRVVGGRMVYEIDVPVGTGGFTNDTWYVRVTANDPDGVADYELNVQHRRDVNECVPDPTGENGTLNTGINLDARPGISENGLVVENVEHLVFDDAAMCADDIDYFCLSAEDGDILEAWIVSDGVLGAVNVQWVDDEDQGVGSQGAVTGTEDETDRAVVAGVTAGRYCARVDGVAIAEGPYSLYIQRRVVMGDMCPQDISELDGGRNDVSRAATPMSVVAMGQRYEEAVAMMCDVESPDIDWYAFPVAPADSRICVSVTGFSNASTDINVELYRDDQAGSPCQSDDVCGAVGACVNGRCQPFVVGGESNTAFDVEMIDIAGGIVGDRIGNFLPRVSHDGEPGAQEPYSITATVIPPISRGDDCPDDWQEIGQQNGDRMNAVPLGLGQVALCDTWLCRSEGLRGDWFELTVPAGEDRTVMVEYPRSQGTLQLFYQGPVTGEENDGFGAVSTATNWQCLNIRAGSVDRPVAIAVLSSQFAGAAERIDYSVRVVETDLDIDALGGCDDLGAPNIDACDPAEQAMSNHNVNACFPTFTLP